MSLTISRRVRVLSTAAVLAGAVALTGCSAHPGKAAVVSFKDAAGVTHTTTYSDAEVSQACTDFKAVASCEQVMAVLVDVPVLDYLIEKHKVTVSDKDVNTVLEGYGVDPSTASSAAKDVARSQAMSGMLSTLDEDTANAMVSEYQTLSQSVTSEVSARYQWPGSWIQTAGSESEQSTGSGQGSEDSGQQGDTQEGTDQSGTDGSSSGQ